MKFDDRFVVLYDQVLHMELRAVLQNLAQLGESALPELLLAAVVTGKGVSAHHDPVDVVSYPFEERSAVAVLKSLKDLTNTLGCNCHLYLSCLLRSVFCFPHAAFDEDGFPWPILTEPSSFIRSLTWMFSTVRAASLISPESPSSTRPATSVSNLWTASSQVNGWEAKPG